MSRKYWSKEEMLFIKNHIDIMSISDFVNYFNVPKNKIIDKIHKMGLNSKNLEVFYGQKKKICYYVSILNTLLKIIYKSYFLIVHGAL